MKGLTMSVVTYNAMQTVLLAAFLDYLWNEERASISKEGLAELAAELDVRSRCDYVGIKNWKQWIPEALEIAEKIKRYRAEKAMSDEDISMWAGLIEYTKDLKIPPQALVGMLSGMTSNVGALLLNYQKKYMP